MSSALTSLNRRAENVRIAPMIVAELKFRNVQRHIFGTDFVERADDTALEDRPEALNRVGVDRADNIAFRGMHHGLARVFVQPVINLVFIGREQRDFIGHYFANEMFGGIFGDAAQRAGDHVALARYSADHWRLAGTCTARFAVMLLVPMPVCVFAADPRFVNFDDAAQLHFRFNEGRADFVAHGMRGAVRAEAHHPLNLQRAHSLFAGQHQMSNAEPLAQWLFGVLEDGPGNVREAIGSHGSALVALPRKSAGQFGNLWIATARAANALGPAAGDQIDAASIFIGERRFELRDRHLMHWFRAFEGGHDVSPDCERNLSCPS
jgi:hypothetical protein